MPPVDVDPRKVREFVDAQGFEDWLRGNHGCESEVWIKLHKKASGLPSISPKEAIDVALCWGWIDAVRKSLDATSYLQRYTPRTSKSIWSKVNVANVQRLVAEGRMTGHGLRQMELAQADGRWDRAYGSGRAMVLPDDLLAAVTAEPAAAATLSSLNAQNRFALAFRLHQMKTDAGRKKKIAAFVDMLKEGQAIYPQAKGGATIAPMFGMSKQARPATTVATKARPVTAAPVVARDDSLVGVQVKLSPAQRDKLQRLGGDAWIRERIDKARDQ